LGSWTNTGSNNDAVLAGTTGTASLNTGISVNDITVNPSPSGTYTIAGSGQTLTLNGTTQSVLDVASSSTLTITSGLAGVNGFTKSSAGTLILDGAGGSNGLVGAITVNAGTLQAGSATNNGASQVLRSNAVNLVGGSLTTVGTQADLRVGALSGSGAVTPATGGAINIHALQDATFSGAITTTGGLNLRGGNGTTQTFSGNLTALTGTLGINSGATMKLSGTGDSTSGVIGATTIAPRGGTFTLDNTNGNTSAAAGRVADATALSFLGGTFSLIGHSSGTSETVGAVTFNPGANTISVTSNGGTGTQLTITDGGDLRDSTAMTVNFVGNGGTLGSSGANPRIVFSSALRNNTSNGMLSSGASSATVASIGWATVNGTSWAGQSSNSIIALADTARTHTNLSSAGANELVAFTPGTATTTLSSSLGIASLKITPSTTGQTLALNSGSVALNTNALMLAGAADFSITGGTLGTSGATRYVYVTDANTALSFSGGLGFSGGNPYLLTKSGAGILSLTGGTSQVSGQTAVVNINVAQGVLRATTAALNGGTSAGGGLTTINLRGGVLEINGGGSASTFSRAVDLAGTSSGGGISFDGPNTARGDGGFSAFNGDATVTLVTTIGGSTAASLVWDNGAFLSNGYVLTMGSTKADSRVDLTIAIGLDNGTATNSYFAREIRVADNTSSTTDVARLSGVISGSANADLLKTGAGVLELTNTNTYSGNTLIQQGTLIATNGAAIANTSAVVISNTAGATFQLNNSETIGALSGGGTTGGSVNIQGNTLTVGDQRDSTFGGIISGSGGSLSKQGTGILSLTNNSTYSGSTSVTAGSLFLNGSLTNTSGTSVSANATLAANGTIANGVSIASSGKMAIGADDAVSTLGSVTVGSMALSGSLEFGATGALTYDKLISTGALAVTSGTIAFKTSGYTVAFNTDFDIVDFGSFTGTPTFDFSGASVQQYGAWDTSAFASTGVISYVPEPSTSLLLGAFGSLALLRRRR
jgi:autotransporter-associated beta strand protein